MSFMDLDVGVPANEDQAKGEKPSAPASLPLPLVMLAFMVAGFLLLRQVWR